MISFIFSTLLSCISTFCFSLPVVASELAQLEEWFREIFKQLFLISEIPRYSSRKYSRFILQFAVNMLSWSHTVDILCEFNLLCVWLFVRWQNFGKEPLNSHKKVILLRKHWKDCSCYSILVCFGGKHGSFLWTWWEMMRVARNWRISENAFKGNFLCIHPATRVPWSHQTGGGKLPDFWKQNSLRCLDVMCYHETSAWLQLQEKKVC